jgi:ABC-2 type transport system ATP-binding protein
LERVLETIRRDVSAGEVRVDNPTQNLESYFLDVVAKARAERETSGAQSGARVAAYLRAGPEDRPATEKVLEKLSLPQAQPPSAKPAAEALTSKVDDHKLAALSQPAAPTSGKPAAEAEAAKPVDLAKADEKLSSLLGGKK